MNFTWLIVFVAILVISSMLNRRNEAAAKRKKEEEMARRREGTGLPDVPPPPSSPGRPISGSPIPSFPQRPRPVIVDDDEIPEGDRRAEMPRPPEMAPTSGKTARPVFEQMQEDLRRLEQEKTEVDREQADRREEKREIAAEREAEMRDAPQPTRRTVPEPVFTTSAERPRVAPLVTPRATLPPAATVMTFRRRLPVGHPARRSPIRPVGREDLRRGIIMAEILDRPMAMRERQASWESF